MECHVWYSNLKETILYRGTTVTLPHLEHRMEVHPREWQDQLDQVTIQIINSMAMIITTSNLHQHPHLLIQG